MESRNNDSPKIESHEPSIDKNLSETNQKISELRLSEKKITQSPVQNPTLPVVSLPLSENGRYNFLAADDVKMNQTILRNSLTKLFPGSHIACVSNGTEATKCHREGVKKNNETTPYNLVILDYNMRKEISDNALLNFQMNGLGSALTMRKFEKENKGAPSIIILASASADTLEATGQYLAQDLIQFIKDAGSLEDLREYLVPHADAIIEKVQALNRLIANSEQINVIELIAQSEAAKLCGLLMKHTFNGIIPDKKISPANIRTALQTFFNEAGDLISNEQSKTSGPKLGENRNVLWANNVDNNNKDVNLDNTNSPKI